MSIRFALISDSKQVTGADLAKMAPALERSAVECWRVWHAYLPMEFKDHEPSVFPWAGSIDGAPALPDWRSGTLTHVVPIYFVDAQSRSAGTLGVHFQQGDRPAARVFMGAGSGLYQGRHSATETASHEINEVLVNPWLDQWDRIPGRANVWMPRENCDAVQTHYPVGEHDVSVSNFSYPAWHGLSNPSSVPADQVDHRGELGAAGELGPEGYRIVRNRDWILSFEYGPKRQGFGARDMDALAHPLSRTRRILESAAGVVP